jgi:hypothetical protein
MAVELQRTFPQLQSAQVDINIHVSATLNITPLIARRKVNALLLNQVGTGLGGDEPSLIVENDRLCWRVPVSLALPFQGQLGQVGQIDVDAQTGEVLADVALLQEIADHAERLVAGSSL